MSNGLPHYHVYARIAPSKIHGVGVKTIRPIKKGAYIFFGDDAPLRWIKRNRLKYLPKELRKLYGDFCIKNGEWYGCPRNFNLMTPAWYLNHSSTPNVASDKSYRFYALRDIKKGEELTVNYGTYSEMGRRQLMD
jgi:hypothetical protein